jgi:hypothetical protein
MPGRIGAQPLKVTEASASSSQPGFNWMAFAGVLPSSTVQ